MAKKNTSVLTGVVWLLYFGSTQGLQLMQPPAPPATITRKSRRQPQQQPLSYSNDIAALDPNCDDVVVVPSSNSNPLAQIVSKLNDPQIRFRVVRWPTPPQLRHLKMPDLDELKRKMPNMMDDLLKKKQDDESDNYFQKGQEAARKAIQDVMTHYNIGGGEQQQQDAAVAGAEESNLLQKAQEAAMKGIRDFMALYNSTASCEGGPNMCEEEQQEEPPLRPVTAIFRLLQKKEPQKQEA